MKTDIPMLPDFPSPSETRSAYQPREVSAIAEINRLHAEAQQLAGESHQSLDGALATTWCAGKLLIAEKARLLRHTGRGA
jgi:hypothetical protein